MADVIDLNVERRRRTGEADFAVEPARVPYMTVHYYEGRTTPLRVVGIPRDAQAMRAAASDMLNGAMAMLAEAYRIDRDPDQHARLLATLYASGRVTLATYNAPGEDGTETRETLTWMRGKVPDLGKLLTELIDKEIT